ncbi:hypothetical protein [Acidovorax sp.]|uniref:hypothetical protein n=1 Tax=Acidovorax sp. TaxID=1872122 RepID=UPI0031D7CF4D
MVAAIGIVGLDDEHPFRVPVASANFSATNKGFQGDGLKVGYPRLFRQKNAYRTTKNCNGHLDIPQKFLH